MSFQPFTKERELEWRRDGRMYAVSLPIHLTWINFHPHIFQYLYVLNQMFIFETFYIFEYLVTRPSKQDQSWIYLNYFLFYIFQLSFK